jgi:hypothetical protein
MGEGDIPWWDVYGWGSKRIKWKEIRDGDGDNKGPCDDGECGVVDGVVPRFWQCGTLFPYKVAYTRDINRPRFLYQTRPNDSHHASPRMEDAPY